MRVCARLQRRILRDRDRLLRPRALPEWRPLRLTQNRLQLRLPEQDRRPIVHFPRRQPVYHVARLLALPNRPLPLLCVRSGRLGVCQELRRRSPLGRRDQDLHGARGSCPTACRAADVIV